MRVGGWVFGDQTERNHLLPPHPPRDPSGAAQGRIQIATFRGKGRAFPVITPFSHPQHSPSSQPDRLYEEVRRVRAHVFRIWLLVRPGGKKGPGKRNPPILTSCFCWKGDPSGRRARQHCAQCSAGSRGDSVFAHGAAHHTESGCQHQNGWSFPNDRWRVGSGDNPPQYCCQGCCARGVD